LPIEAVNGTGVKRQSPSVTVTAEYDTEILHLGAATGLGHEAVSSVKVRRCMGGQWYSEVFPLRVGEAIGCVTKTGGKTVDFSTGYRLVSVESGRRSIPHLRNRQKVSDNGKKVVDAEGKPVYEQIVEYVERNDVKLTVTDAAGNPRQIWSGDSIRGGQGKFKE
jgi:hypothetical protein